MVIAFFVTAEVIEPFFDITAVPEGCLNLCVAVLEFEEACDD